MLGIGSPHQPLSRDLLNARGGFAWWYLDAVDAEGTGFVVIWSFGLPFLPGYTSAAREGQAPEAGRRPSVNVAVYDRGEPVFYLLQEVEPEAAFWQPGTETVRIGGSQFRSETVGNERVVRVHLDMTVPGSGEVLRGDLHLRGPLVRIPGEQVQHDHVWTPLSTGGLVEGSVKLGDRDLWRGKARAYHDRNGSPRHIDGWGIGRWSWGRVAFPDHEKIWYVLWPKEGDKPQAFGIEVRRDGEATAPFPLDFEVKRGHITRYLLDVPDEIVLSREGEPWMVVEQARAVDNGPFYVRWACKGDGHPGMSEWVVPGRVDHALVRPFVRMATHRVGADNSVWLPLFAGSSEGRWSRLRPGQGSLEGVPG